MTNNPLYGRLPGEPLRWFQRYERFRLMQPVRSIAGAFREEMGGNERKEAPGRWYEEAKRWHWEERAAAWDAEQDEQVEKQIAAERKKILCSRYALMHKRVELLDRKIQQLTDITDDDDKVWLRDVKAIGLGPQAKRVDLITFNDAAFKELREYLTDIADELGERVKKSETAITQLPPNVYIGFDPDLEEGTLE